MSLATLVAMNLHRLAFVSLAAWTGLAHADIPLPSSAFMLAGGMTMHGTSSITAGITWQLPWSHVSRSGVWSTYAELWVSRWHSDAVNGGHASLDQVGLVPMLRYRFDHGRSPWFAEGGIGLSYMDRIYHTPQKLFSTKFNFADTIGFGYSFGAHHEQEIGLRAAHFSNAGIRHPNPGENFLQVRYSHAF